MKQTSAIKALLNPYLIGFIIIYFCNLIIANKLHSFNTDEILGIFIIVGIVFSAIAYAISRKATLLIADKTLAQHEILLLIFLPIYITIFIVLGNTIFFVPQDTIGIPKELATISRKVLTFVIIPFLLYRVLFKFNHEDFGLSTKWKQVFSKQNILIFVVMSAVVLLLNYFGGRGAKPIRDGEFFSYQLLIGLPLLFAWLYIEVGLVEEFFFRALLQNRLSLFLKSEIGAICITAFIFGLVHTPGMYLRDAGIIEGLGESPSLIASIGYCIAIQSIPGFFFGIIWSKTKNLWLLMGIHAMVDLLPNFAEFIHIWRI